MIEELKFPYQQRYSIFVLIYDHKRQGKEKLCKMFVNAIIQIFEKVPTVHAVGNLLLPAILFFLSSNATISFFSLVNALILV